MTESKSKELMKRIEQACEGLIYISEIDADIEPFAGSKADRVTSDTALKHAGKEATAPIEERAFEEFFKRLTTVKEWHGDAELEKAKKFQVLYELLKEDLRQIKVFRVGRIRLDIFVIGLDKYGSVVGVKTQAVET
ncbi:nuclease A inhibitor family protein [soil metagenome]